MTIGNRIKRVRQSLDLTQTEFAARLGLTQNTVTRYETGDRKPSTAVLSLIIQSYSVNEGWLRTGEGEMFVKKSREDEIETLMNQLLSGENSEFKRRFIRALASLTEKQWAVIEEKAQEIAGRRTEPPEMRFVDETPSYSGWTREELHAELDRQLDAQKEAEASASASPAPVSAVG